MEPQDNTNNSYSKNQGVDSQENLKNDQINESSELPKDRYYAKYYKEDAQKNSIL